MKISNKLRLFAIVPITLAIVVAGTVYHSANSIDKARRQERAAVHIVNDVFELDVYEREFLYQSEQVRDRAKQQWLSTHEALAGQLDEIRPLTEEDQRTLRQTRAHHGQMGSHFERIVKSRQQADRTATEMNLVRKLTTESTSFRTMAGKFANSNHMAAKKTQDRANFLVLVLVTATVPILLLISGLVTRSITKPIARLQEGAEVIGQGDLDHRVATGARDEIGELSRDFDQMAIKLQMMIDELKQSDAEVRALNESLERRVAERTAESEQRAKDLDLRNRDLETLLYVASHDLREPLRAIQNFSRLVIERYADQLDEQGQDFLKRVMRGADRLDGLLEDVLTLSRAQRMETPTGTADANDIVIGVLKTLESKIQETGAVVNVAEDLPVLQADRRWATQAVFNLVANALKFTNDGQPPDIEIGPYCANDGGADEVGIVVRDRGIGIAPKHAERIFTLFQRAVGREVDGHGAGLAIVNQVAERHGGRVWVQPRDGGGSAFVLTFGAAPQG